MRVYGRWAVLVAFVLGLSETARSQHGRPAMLYVVDHLSAKPMQIFPDGDESEALDINNLGDMVGWATADSNSHPQRAFKRGLLGSTVDLTHDEWPSSDARATGINDYAEVVGYRDDGYNVDAFYWSQTNGLYPLNENGGTLDESRAYAINNHGRIVGSLTPWSGTSDAVTWSKRYGLPVMFYTPPAGAVTQATDLSDAGWLVGTEWLPSPGPLRGFRVNSLTKEYLPNPSGNQAFVNAVNEAGTVVGAVKTYNCCTVAIRWRRAGDPLMLGGLPGGMSSAAFDINETEFIAGTSDMVVSRGDAPRTRAFLFHHDFGMFALPVPTTYANQALSDCGANALNDRKENGLIQVAGYCTRNGKKEVVRWDVFVNEIPYTP